MKSVGAGLRSGSDTTSGGAGPLPGPITVSEVLRLSTEHLAAKGSETPRLDAERLLAKATGLERIELYMQLDRELTAAELDEARGLVARRARREPLQYVLGEWGFRRLTLTVDRRALIPRPETEVLVGRALALLAGLEQPRVLDVGTGSGAIAIAIADEHPGAVVTGLDSSPDALALAAENTARTGIAVELVEGDLFRPLPDGPWDLVVANPPYVAAADLPGLQPEVRDWEPQAALSADGAVEAVIRGAAVVLDTGGALALEVGAGQADATAALLEEVGFVDVLVTRDLGGLDRVVEGRLGVTDVDAIVRAILDGELAVLPTDTVYGLVCNALDEQPATDLYRLKGRESAQPTAVLAASVEALLEWIPEIDGRAAATARVLFPGPFTLVVQNPARRLGWLCEGRPDSIGVRVPALAGFTAEIVGRLGLVVATSANLAGGADPRRLADVPTEILAGVAAALDGGDLPGVPSTVIDLTVPEPLILREGAGDSNDALARIATRLT